MKLRLYHHPDGARVAYREAGIGPPLALLHSAGLSHKEFEPSVEYLTDRFRVILPDLPGHGDSEDRPRHPYSPDWLADVAGGFCREVLGPRPLVGGHGLGADLLLRATLRGGLEPSRLVLMSSRLHAAPQAPALQVWRTVTRAAAVPGLGRVLSHGTRAVFRPELGAKLSARGNPDARDLLRHAFADVAGNGNRARSWAKLARGWPTEAQDHYLDEYSRLTMPVLLLWASEDRYHPVETAEEAMRRMPDALLRILPGTGFLMAYDDPVGLARELVSFCS